MVIPWLSGHCIPCALPWRRWWMAQTIRTLWAFIPIWLLTYAEHWNYEFNVSLWSFICIAVGFIGCALGGVISDRIGSAKVAVSQLWVSGTCCVLSPLLYYAEPWLFFTFLMIWGVTVIGDSPQFSALNAQNAPRESVGSALTIANCIGFLITIFSIQLVTLALSFIPTAFIFWLLIPGPVFGLLAMRSLPNESTT